MNGWQMVGAGMVVLLFVGIFVFGAVQIGWRAMAGVYAVTAAIVAFVALSEALMTGALP
jgi:hypothetical protein